MNNSVVTIRSRLGKSGDHALSLSTSRPLFIIRPQSQVSDLAVAPGTARFTSPDVTGASSRTPATLTFDVYHISADRFRARESGRATPGSASAIGYCRRRALSWSAYATPLRSPRKDMIPFALGTSSAAGYPSISGIVVGGRMVFLHAASQFRLFGPLPAETEAKYDRPLALQPDCA